MIFDPRIFYLTFQKDYHKIKAVYLKGMLDNLPKYEIDFFGGEFNEDDRTSFRRTLKSDLRQTYFHAIETFFELFFALTPNGKISYDDNSILFDITYSKDTYGRIKEIAEDENALNFLDNEIEVTGISISIAHYLFYTGIFSNDNIPNEVFENINESIVAIKHAIKIIAADFIKREEYNAYKHGLRIIPSVTNFALADAKTKEIKIEWDISDSMSFYLKTKFKDELTVVTKVFDSERDFLMTQVCSDLIHHLIFYKRISLQFESDVNKFEQIPIRFMDMESINNCNKRNAGLSDIIYTITKIVKG